MYPTPGMGKMPVSGHCSTFHTTPHYALAQQHSFGGNKTSRIMNKQGLCFFRFLETTLNSNFVETFILIISLKSRWILNNVALFRIKSVENKRLNYLLAGNLLVVSDTIPSNITSMMKIEDKKKNRKRKIQQVELEYSDFW